MTNTWFDQTRRLATSPEVAINAGEEYLLVNDEDWREYAPACGGDVNVLEMWGKRVARSADIPRGTAALCLPSSRSVLDGSH